MAKVSLLRPADGLSVISAEILSQSVTFLATVPREAMAVDAVAVTVVRRAIWQRIALSLKIWRTSSAATATSMVT